MLFRSALQASAGLVPRESYSEPRKELTYKHKWNLKPFLGTRLLGRDDSSVIGNPTSAGTPRLQLLPPVAAKFAVLRALRTFHVSESC